MSGLGFFAHRRNLMHSYHRNYRLLSHNNLQTHVHRTYVLSILLSGPNVPNIMNRTLSIRTVEEICGKGRETQ
jgi:hypothetical protein